MPAMWPACRTALVTTLVAVLAFSPTAEAKKAGNARAKKLVRAAMEKDYLDLEFRKAETKMKKALTICRTKGCSKGLHARIYRYLAVVYALGLKDQDAATFAFIDMLKLSPKLKPDRNFAAEEIDRAFKKAKKAYLKERAEEEAEEAERRRKEEEEEERIRAAEEAAAEEQRQAEEEEAERIREAEEAAAEEQRLAEEAERERREEEERKKREPPPVGELEEEPWVEQALEIPIPIFVELEETPEGQKVKKVVAEYITPDGQQGKITLKPHETGWGGYIPCKAVKKKGELQYWVTVIQQYDHPLATAGTEDEPRIVFIKEAVDYKQPHLPGELPPEGCFGTEGDDVVTCETDADCPGKTTCSVGQCVKLGKAQALPQPKRNRFGLLVAPDFSLISSSEACSVASREDGRFSCFQTNGVEYEDTPNSNTNAAGSFSTIAPGTLRISLLYDRVVGDNLTLGGRIGATLLGHPARNDGKSVSPVHVEGRAGYYFGARPFSPGRTKAFVHGILGFANAAGKITGVQVRPGGEDGLDVWQKGGPLVVGLGGGIEIAIGASGGLVLDLTVRESLPTTLTTFAPTLGYVHAL